MHIEPGLVDSSKIVLSYATAAAAGAVALRTVVRSIGEKGPVSLLLRSAIATVCVFIFFEVMPHFPVGVSEVHFILGSTLFLILGAAPSAVGLAMGLLIQGLFFSPIDLPQYGMNVTTLLVPLFALYALAGKVIAPGTAYVDLKYSQALTLSTAYQGGVVGWVAFWAIYGRSRDFGCGQVVACAARLAAGDAAALSRGLIGAGSKNQRGRHVGRVFIWEPDDRTSPGGHRHRQPRAPDAASDPGAQFCRPDPDPAQGCG
jgi:ABC-type Co2+ transport system permease subunit